MFINKYQQSLDYENEIPHNIFQENTLMYVILKIEYLHFPLSLFVITLRVKFNVKHRLIRYILSMMYC